VFCCSMQAWQFEQIKPIHTRTRYCISTGNILWCFNLTFSVYFHCFLSSGLGEVHRCGNQVDKFASYKCSVSLMGFLCSEERCLYWQGIKSLGWIFQKMFLYLESILVHSASMVHCTKSERILVGFSELTLLHGQLELSTVIPFS
jgi:hypothetical protein